MLIGLVVKLLTANIFESGQMPTQLGMTGKLSMNFHGVGIGPLSKILAVKILLSA